jgi:hypothetical protein
MAQNMLDSFHARQIVSSINELSREVGRLRDEVSRHREKLGPQPEWLIILGPAAVVAMLITLLIIDAVKEDRAPSTERPRIEMHPELPEKSS